MARKKAKQKKNVRTGFLRRIKKKIPGGPSIIHYTKKRGRKR